MTTPAETPPPNTPTDPNNARATEVRQGQRMPGMITVLIVSIVALGAIYMAMLAFGVGANNDEQQADELPQSELLDEAPPDIAGQPSNQQVEQ